MKKKMCLMVLGLAVVLSACGGTDNAGSTADTATTENTAEVTETESADAETSESEASEEGTESQEAVPEESEDTGDTFAAEELDYVEDMILSTELITVNMPEEFKGKFYATVDKDQISFYDKATVDEGFPGYVFTIVTTADNDIYVGGMFTKQGEVLTSDGTFYNVSVGYASDVQWDYTKYEEMPESYDTLLHGVDTIMQSVVGTGDNNFMYKSGTKGEDIYQYTLSRYITAFSEGWDANKFEEEDMSPEFYALAQATDGDVLDKIGYAYMDITDDGIDDLLVGEITDTDEPSVVYDIYTTVDKMPAHVVSGTARNRYYALTYGGVANEYSNGAAESGLDVYNIETNTTELFPQFRLKYDANTDEKNPWFISYASEDTWEPMTEEEYNDRMDGVLEQYVKLDYKPLSDLAPIDYSKVDLSKYDTFTKMIDDFKPGMGYANVNLGDTDVFLVSTGTYIGEGDKENAIDASVFMYDDNGAIVYLGQVESAGTAYPLAVADGNIFTCAHHSVVKSTVKDGKLVTSEMAEEIFDESGNATYTHSEDGGEAKDVEDDSVITGLFDEYSKAEVIEFSKVSE